MDFINYLYLSKITVITFPRNFSRHEYAKHIFNNLDIYCTVINPKIIIPEVDIAIFTSPDIISSELMNNDAVIIVLSTWGDAVIDTKQTLQYVAPPLSNFNIDYVLENSFLTHEQLLYYDRISISKKDMNDIKSQLHNLVGIHLYSPHVMEQLIEHNELDLKDEREATKAYPKMNCLIESLNKYSEGTSLVYTSNPELILNLLTLSRTTSSVLIYNEEIEFELPESGIISIHLFDDYTFINIKSLLEKIFNHKNYESLIIHLYVSVHPDIESEDVNKYNILSQNIKKYDEIYQTAILSNVVDEEFKVYQYD